MVKCFAKITIFSYCRENYIIDVLQGPKYTSGMEYDMQMETISILDGCR